MVLSCVGRVPLDVMVYDLFRVCMKLPALFGSCIINLLCFGPLKSIFFASMLDTSGTIELNSVGMGLVDLVLPFSGKMAVVMKESPVFLTS